MIFIFDQTGKCWGIHIISNSASEINSLANSLFNSPIRSFICIMFKSTKHWTYLKKISIAEMVYLFIFVMIVPLSVGVQIFSDFSFTLSLILVHLLNLPSLILFYRWLLPKTLFNKKPFVFLIALPLFLIIYELNARLTYVIIINLPFVPVQYRTNLASVEPWKWTGRLLQNLDYTVLLLLSATGLFFIKELFKRQHKLDQLQSDKLKLELDQLKSQIQPHFFFNTLNNLYAMSLQGSAKTSQSIANLSEIMRYVLYETRGEKVMLEKEIVFLKSYLDLECIRYADENIIQFSVQGNSDGILIEPLLFLPLIENCFKHSLQHKISGNQVQLILTIDEDEITFQTSNLLIQKSVTGSSENGIGLHNVRKRLELLYPGKHQLVIVEEESKFIVTLTIQLNKI